MLSKLIQNTTFRSVGAFSALRQFSSSKPTIDGFFEGKSYVVLGASTKVGSLGWSIASNFNATFEGDSFFVNPRGGELLGKELYKSLNDLPMVPESACICTPAKQAVKDAKTCIDMGVKNLIIIAGGFAEADEEGFKAQEELVKMCQESGTRLVGPNGMGVFDNNTGTNTLFISRELLELPEAGPISVITQSGALGCSLMNLMCQHEKKDWVSRFISFGNAADVNENDSLEYLGRDENTKQIWTYLEGIRDAPEYLRQLRSTCGSKPVLTLKASRGDAGAHASGSHSASLAANDEVCDYLLRQAGSLRIETWPEFFQAGVGLLGQSLPKGNRVGIVTNAGGCGVMAADAVEHNELELPMYSEKTVSEFYDTMPSFFQCVNPMDLTGSATTEQYLDATELALKDDNIDSVLLMIQPSGPVLDKPEEFCRKIIERFGDKKFDKPIIPVIFGGNGDYDKLYNDKLISAGFPMCMSPESGVRTIRMMRDYAAFLEREEKKIEAGVPVVPEMPTANPEIQKIIDGARADGRKVLLEPESRDIFRMSGLPVPADVLAHTPEEAVAFWESVKTPLVMKLVSPQVIHKTDEGAVFVNKNNAEDVYETAKHLFDKFEGRDVRGVLLYEMVPHGTEMVIGMNTDDVFGPLVLVGAGGAMVEILNDATFNMCPTDRFDADEMLNNLTHQALLEGYRGSPAVNREEMSDMIVKISNLAAAHSEDIKEMDANPIIACPDGDHWAVDARILLH